MTSERVETIDGQTALERLIEAGHDSTAIMAVLERALQRGDGIALYRNEALGHPEGGHWICASFGSPQAQLETDDPPVTFPELNGYPPMWRYQLRAIVPKGT
jgi:hypothetical protein